MPELSNYAKCYEGIQRVYRNAVVDAARRALQIAYPDDWGARIQELFGTQWYDMVTQAEESRVVGQLGAPVEDELDYLGVNHFFNLFEKFFDGLFPTGVAVPERTRQQERNAVLNWAKVIQVLRNPISHPSSDDLSYEDAFQALDAARRILLKIDHYAASQVREITGMLRRQSISADTPSIEELTIAPEAIEVTSGEPDRSSGREVKDTMIQDVDPFNARIYFDRYMYVGDARMMAHPHYFAPYFTRACETDPRTPEVLMSGISRYSRVIAAESVPGSELQDLAFNLGTYMPSGAHSKRWTEGLDQIRQRAIREKWHVSGRHRLYFLDAPVSIPNTIQKHGRLPQIPYGFGTSFDRLNRSQHIKDLKL